MTNSPDPWVQAVNPLQVAVEAMQMPDPALLCASCRDDAEAHPINCDECAPRVIRAALPHLLRAVVGALAESDLVEVWLKGEYGGKAHRVATETMRAALLAALANAAERVVK